MAAQSHQSDPRILGRRTLERDHRRLAALLRPGQSVLDVGCGVGAITAGIARAVGPAGAVVGLDRDESLLEIARAEAALPNLRFERGDAAELGDRAGFDIVTAARTLQWIADPGRAVRGMKRAAKPSGMIVVLDYNHAANRWEPEPPAEFGEFYSAFLAWRVANGWDNEMADHLPGLFREAGLDGVESQVEDEIVERGAEDFVVRSALWAEVIESLGARVAAAGFYPAGKLEAVRERYLDWTRSGLVRQTLVMRTVTGFVPK